jgi:hypothetical protein
LAGLKPMNRIERFSAQFAASGERGNGLESFVRVPTWFRRVVADALDGGTSLAEKGRLYVVDERGNRLGEGLHEDFVGYLLETGRLV